jgi:hypothetical protein
MTGWAVAKYQHEQANPSVPKKSLRKVADIHGVNYRTLGRHVAGGVLMSEFNALKQKLSMPEEHIIVEYALEEADRGFPPSLKDLENVAEAILES